MNNPNSIGEVIYKTYRAINITIPMDVMKKIGFWKTVWGLDIFINNIPILKAIVLANVLVWVALLVYITGK